MNLQEIKPKTRVNFSLFGKKLTGIYILSEKDKSLIFLDKKIGSVGWKLNTNEYAGYAEVYKKLFPTLKIEDALFCWITEFDSIDEEDSKQNTINTSEILKQEENKMKDEKINQTPKEKETWATYGKRVCTEGARLAFAKKIVQKVQEGLVHLIMMDISGGKVLKKKELELAQKYATQIMHGTTGFFLTGAALGFLIKGAGDFGGEYATILQHPEIQKFAESVHTVSVMEGGTIILDKIEEMIRPMISQFVGEASQLRVAAEEIQKSLSETEKEAETEIQSLEEDKRKKTLSVQN